MRRAAEAIRAPDAAPAELDAESGCAGSAASRRALLVAYHYPPCQESSGYLRSLAFSRYLGESGWDPVVLTASIRAYSRADPDQCARIPASLPVFRAFARDVREHFSIRRKYPALLAVPDRWSSWWLGAVPMGLSLVRRYRPRIIWATQPNPTAFWVAHTLHRLTGVPWVADFRDPITASDDNPWARRACRWIERKTIDGCSRAVFTAPDAARLYARRYPHIPADRWTIIPNGYDESDFDGLDIRPSPERAPLRLVHSGALYPEGRNPRPLIAAIGKLKASGALTGRDLKIILRGSGHENVYNDLIRQASVDDIVHLEPAVSHRQALTELCSADGLLILQGRMHNGQIPAKVYEYLRVRKPILALTDRVGDTGRILSSAGIDTIVPMDREEEIAVGLEAFVKNIRAGVAPVASDAIVATHSRKARARQLADVFDEVVATTAGGNHV
ncbi:MAG TPA: glycosyltransferase [Gammaproteobacteria bacterium]|nr:glycosyltransferase [Gammaproteobacteria bacterium]